MTTKSERLTVLSDAEQEALYGLPDFDDAQRLEYLALTETELALASSRPGLHAQVYCILQIGYFKAKHAFFRFDWSEVEHDCAFVLSRYFHGESFEHKPISKHEHYTQREQVAELFGYRLWTSDFLPQLGQQAKAGKFSIIRMGKDRHGRLFLWPVENSHGNDPSCRYSGIYRGFRAPRF